MRTEHIDLGDTNQIILFSDIHFHEYKPFSKPTTDGIGSRFQWILHAMDLIFEYAVAEKIKHLFFLGDLYHQRTLIYSVVFDRVAACIERAKESGLEIHAILGNHDYVYNNDNSPSIVKRIRGLDVIDSPTLYLLRDRDEKIGCMPFRFKLPQLREDLKELREAIEDLPPHQIDADHLLLGHFEIDGAAVNDEYVLSEVIDKSEFEGTHFKFILSGHIHKRQALATNNGQVIEYIGTPLQHTFTNEGSPYGFVVYDFEGEAKSKHIELSDMADFPEFVTLEFRSQDDVKAAIRDKKNRFNIDYYRLRTYADDLKLESIFKRLPNYTFEPMGVETSQNTESEEDEGALKFNLNIGHYLRLFAEQEAGTQTLDWLDINLLVEYLMKVATKGNICLE